MSRPATLRATLACAFVATAVAASAADVTQVASSAEPENPFDLHLSVRYERARKRATITRERPSASGDALVDQPALHYEEVSNVIVPRLAVGLWQDLELHLDVPYVLSDDHSWRYGVDSAGNSLEDRTGIADETTTPEGGVGPPTPIFPVPATVFHGGKLGDLRAGVAWDALSDRRDDVVATWLIGFDVTFPTADRYDPTTGLGSSSDAKVSFGRKVWAVDLYTALSRRMGTVDPYVRGHVLLQRRGPQTYSNCDHPERLANGGASCDSSAWDDEGDARPPWIAGVTLGTEVVPYDDRASSRRFAIDLRLSGDYVSRARWFNELTDATGKLLATQEYLRTQALVGLSWRFAQHLEARAQGWFEHQTSHFLTGESLGRTSGSSALPDPAAQNPNYDFRYDQVGKRFRTDDVFNVGFTAALAMSF